MAIIILFAFLRSCVDERLFVMNSIHCGANQKFVLNIGVASLTLYISETWPNGLAGVR